MADFEDGSRAVCRISDLNPMSVKDKLSGTKTKNQVEVSDLKPSALTHSTPVSLAKLERSHRTILAPPPEKDCSL